MGDFITAVRELRLFPGENWQVYECQFDIEYFSDSLYSQWGIDCPKSVRYSVRSRRAEFLAGRYASQLALQALGLQCCCVRVGLHRAPIWPPGVAGSISHDSCTALACAGFKTEGVIGVGIDREPMIDPDVAARVGPGIAKPHELAHLDSSRWPFNEALTLVFSAKESFFKAVYPTVGRYLDFDAVSVAALQAFPERLVLVATQESGPLLPENSTHYSYFYNINNCFTTGVLFTTA